MVNDRLSLKLKLLEKANNDIRIYKKLYELVEEEAKLLPAVMDTEEYVRAVVEGAGKIVKEMVENMDCKEIPTEKEVEAMVTGLSAVGLDISAKEEEVAK